MIDDSTSEIPVARFFEGEKTMACMKVLRAVIESKGVPQIIYTDQAGWAGGAENAADSANLNEVISKMGLTYVNPCLSSCNY
jgi:hypothetical protein